MRVPCTLVRFTYVRATWHTGSSPRRVVATQGRRHAGSPPRNALVYDCVNPPYPELVKPFQSKLGHVMYLCNSTRCDIVYPVHQLARCMCKPTPDLVLELDHLLAYLIRTRTLGLTYSRESSKLEAYSDASWEERNSTSGWVALWQYAAVSWGSRRQQSVALSSCEAEIRSDAGRVPYSVRFDWSRAHSYTLPGRVSSRYV